MSFLTSWIPCFAGAKIRLPEKDLEANTGEGHSCLPFLHACAFCDVSVENGFRVVWEDDSYVAFLDRNPSAQHHIQLVPKVHIRSVRELTQEHAALLKTMREIANEILDSYDIPTANRKLGFHIPPYISVSHLHLHIQALPYISSMRAAKYPISTPWQTFGRRSKGFSWFVDVNQAIDILERGKKVGILPT